jgi:hypothetical protein
VRLAGLLLLLAGVTAAVTGRERAAEPFPPEPGFTSLFNGKDLTGWRYHGSKGEPMEGKTSTPDGRIEVKDGVIVCHEKNKDGKGGIRDLYTAREFNKDFHLKLQFRAAPRADSGVYIRGPQLQVRDYPRAGPYKPKGFKDNDWNDLDIRVKSGVVVTTVNGKALTDKDTLEVVVKDGKPEVKLNGKEIDAKSVIVSKGDAAECKCNGEVLEAAFKVPAKGGIGLQAESGKFEFRHIQVKEE